MSNASNIRDPNKGAYLIVGSTMGLVFAVYVIHLFSMQVVDNFTYQDRASNVSSRTQIVSSLRGSVYDRHADVAIAGNQSSYALLVTPGDLIGEGRRDVLVSNLANILGIASSTAEQMIPLAARTYEPVLAISSVSYPVIAHIAESIEKYPGLTWVPRPQRTYPFGDLFSQVLGYVGDISQEELQVLFNEGYNPGSIIGKAGIERSLDSVLKGQDGLAINQVDVFGRRTGGEEVNLVRPPELGASVVLTIDRNIQELSKKALGGRVGSVLVMKPATGEILAMVSEPGYDPNSFYDELGASNFRAAISDSNSPFINRNLQAAAPPASTFKVLMSLIALEEEVIDPTHTIRCTGSVTIGDRTFRCWNPAGHGSVNLYEALAESCNVYFYTLGYEYLNIDTIAGWSERMGLGQTTGIDLPGEVRGLVPSTEWKERTFNSPWVGGDTVNLSIGQGYLTVTPIQLAGVVNALVNNGTIYRPHVLKEVRDPVTFEIVQSVEPSVIHQTGISAQTAELVKTAMRKVIVEGTAISALTTNAVEIAGKTGTAQTGAEDSKHSWFAAYAPYEYDNPQDVVSVVVWIDASNEWDWWAPKAANIIFHGIFNDLNYEETLRDLSPLWYITREMLNG